MTTIRSLTALGAAIAIAAALQAAPGAASADPTSDGADVATLHAEALAGTLDRIHGLDDICAANALACSYQVVTSSPGSGRPLETPDPTGLGADDLAKAYGLEHAASANGTIAILDAAHYPPAKLESDLAAYRSQYGLPPCTIASRCLTIRNMTGGRTLPPKPVTDRDKLFTQYIGVETALDVDMASAACPRCSIIELQLPLNAGLSGTPQHVHHATSEFGVAAETAVAMHANAITISYGFKSDRFTDTRAPARSLDQPGVAITAASGDTKYNGTKGLWPGVVRTIISVGGTTLTAADNARGFTEAAWRFASSSCAPHLGPAVGQPKSVSVNCNGLRASTDISAAASNIAMYDTYVPSSHQPYEWLAVGGTSASSPFIAGIAARAPANPDISGPNTVYAAPPSAFNDVTTGANGTAARCTDDGFTTKLCLAGVGWDGPTGVGTPKGLKPFTS